MFSRRGFLVGTAGALAGCRLPGSGSVRSGRIADCWSTFETQCMTSKKKPGRRTGRMPGEHCCVGDRDNMNEEALFGGDGWVNFFPDLRKDLLFLLGDGWDVPYGADDAGGGISAFGSSVPDCGRFAFLAGSPSGLARLGERIRDAGWKGVGLRVSPQMAGETCDSPCEDWAMLEEDLKRKLGDSAEGNIAYWKVGWGVHGRDMRYRRLMSELKEVYAPDLIIDHGWVVGNAFNGHPSPKTGWKVPVLPDITGGGRCRMTDNTLYDGVRSGYEALMEFSDVVHTGDTLLPLCTATALDRAVFAVECADKIGSRAVVNIGDEALIAAVLGLEFEMSRAPSWPRSGAELPWNRCERMAEASRCVSWHRLAPPFGSDGGIRLGRSMERLEESWRFGRGGVWWDVVQGREILQTAPAVVARGLPLPIVKSLEPGGDVPFVAAGRNPNGAKSVASIPLLTQEKGFHTPRASVALDARLAPEEPLGVFGVFGELVVTLAEGRPSRVTACDLAGGYAEDITAATVFSGGRLTLDGETLSRIGTRQNPTGDSSSPGLVLELS